MNWTEEEKKVIEYSRRTEDWQENKPFRKGLIENARVRLQLDLHRMPLYF